jgi:hypothetical protein
MGDGAAFFWAVLITNRIASPVGYALRTFWNFIHLNILKNGTRCVPYKLRAASIPFAAISPVGYALRTFWNFIHLSILKNGTRCVPYFLN